MLAGRASLVLAVFVLADVPPGSCNCGREEDLPREVPGTATITKIAAAPPGQNNCQLDPVEVLFDFVPDNSAGPANSDDHDRHLTVGAGTNPGREYVNAKHIAEGNRYTCVKLIYKSTVTYDFPGLTLHDYAMGCWKDAASPDADPARP